MAAFSIPVVHPNLLPSDKIKTSIRFHVLCPVSVSTSSLPKNYLSHSPNPKVLAVHKTQPTFFKTFRDGAAVLLLGSFLLLGRYGRRPSLALSDPLKSNISDCLEEKIETQKKKERDDDDDELYARLLERDPADVDALKLCLYAEMKKGKREEAVKYLERLIALDPDEVEWRLLHALLYELMGHFGKAKKLFKEILKERPLLVKALYGLALAMHKNKEGPAAFVMLDKALDIAHRERRLSEERSIRIIIAQMYVLKGDLDVALRQFEDLIKEEPRDFRPHLCQGITYSLLGKRKEANEEFDIYQSLVPDEFPQRDFFGDVILAAKTELQEQP
ncbi:protein SLOW GREEN 1, chloroplastic [Phalaenopsis equestris]|uniref:protein SLOW GREEN 1, chloroplastic n=1 Tax=Phalaenopsis equestris TaxID=78828 RepID=UPI0009E5EE38|nr:protein SLOW GREEN 1, chloroplastic [Phalaenopsis equestris]